MGRYWRFLTLCMRRCLALRLRVIMSRDASAAFHGVDVGVEPKLEEYDVRHQNFFLSLLR